jgi:hypothetical protein
VFTPFSKRAKLWEPTALGLRKLLGLGLEDPLDPWQLAPKVGLRVVDEQTVRGLLDGEDRAHLLDTGSHCWSGGVYPTPLPDGNLLCILNPTHSHRRSKITLMEEIVHTHLKHKPTKLVIVADGIQVRNYDRSQEEEAYGVGAAALVPWRPLFAALNGSRTINELAEQLDLSTDLIGYRIKIAGAHRLYQARQRQQPQGESV